jgi:hypothetical protein
MPALSLPRALAGSIVASLGCFVSLVAWGGSSPPAPRDLAGIHLGMSLQEASNFLAKQQPPYHLDPNTPSHPSWMPGVTYVGQMRADQYKGPPGTYPTDSFLLTFSIPPSPSRVVGIVHTSSPVPDERPSLDNVKSALRQKFGEDIPGTGRPMLFWAWGHDGAPLAAAAARLCTGEGTQVAGPLSPGETMAPSLKTSSCGTVAYASLTVNGPVVTQIETELWDVDASIAARAKAIALANEITQQQQNDAVDKANKNKPSL